MFGFSYGEIFLILGAAAALIFRAKGLAGDSENRGEISGSSHWICATGSWPLRHRYATISSSSAHEVAPGAVHTEDASKSTMGEVSNEETHRGIVQAATNSKVSNLCDMHSQAAAYPRLADSSMLQSGSLRSGADAGELIGNIGLLNVLPISAESTGMLPNCPGDMKGSDIVLEAILEAEVAHNAKSFLDSLKIG